MGSESDCLLGQLNRILEISDLEAGLKVENSWGVIGEVGECGDADVELLARERRSLDILSVTVMEKHIIANVQCLLFL